MKKNIIIGLIVVFAGYIGYVIGGSGQTEYIITPRDCGEADIHVDILEQENYKLAKQIDSLNVEIEEMYDLVYELMPRSQVTCKY